MPRSRLWPVEACGAELLVGMAGEATVEDGVKLMIETTVVVSTSVDGCPLESTSWVVSTAVEVDEKRVLGEDVVELEDTVELEDDGEAEDIAVAGETAVDEELEVDELDEEMVATATSEPKSACHCAALTELFKQQLPFGMP